jgi:hypothetical protein
MGHRMVTLAGRSFHTSISGQKGPRVRSTGSRSPTTARVLDSGVATAKLVESV